MGIFIELDVLGELTPLMKRKTEDTLSTLEEKIIFQF